MASYAGATQEEIRRRNLSTVLRRVHVRGAQSRAQITASMGLNRSTIKALVGELIDAGMVTETIPESARRAGRPSHLVVPRPDTAYVLAGRVEVDVVTVAAVGLGGVILAREEHGGNPNPAPEIVARELCAGLRALQPGLPASGWLAGVGIAVPGLVRAADGWVELAPNLGWRAVPFGEMLAQQLGTVPTINLGNDGDLGALAEHTRGCAQDLGDILYLSGEVGVGGGIIVGGQIVFGAHGYAAEVGHMVINPTGRRCRCGSRGCFETEVGEEAVLLACGRDPHTGRSGLQEVLAAASEGDKRALDGLHSVGTWLARGVASLVNIFDPEAVILGGTLAALLQVAGDTIQAELDALTKLTSQRLVRLAQPGLGGDSTLLGAAELAFERLLNDPLECWAKRAG